MANINLSNYMREVEPVNINVNDDGHNKEAWQLTMS